MERLEVIEKIKDIINKSSINKCDVCEIRHLLNKTKLDKEDLNIIYDFIESKQIKIKRKYYDN